MKSNVFLFLLLILSFSIVSAAPPFQVQETGSPAISIEVPVIEYLALNKPFNFYLHAYNSTNGAFLTNTTTNCIIHIYNTSTGSHIIETGMIFDNNKIDFKYNVLKGNFSVPGQYSALFYCNNSQGGGFFEFPFWVNPLGTEPSIHEAIYYIALILGIILIFFIFLSVAILTPYRNLEEITEQGEKAIVSLTKTKYVKVMASWFAYGSFVWLLTILTSIGNNYITFVGVKGLMNNLYLLFYGLGYGVTMFVVVLLIVLIWKDIVLNKIILREGKAILSRM